jgi:hypothetical protein
VADDLTPQEREIRALSHQPPPDQPYPDLVLPNDPDWLSFQTKDESWYLRAAGRAIRKYCGWHIYPNIRQTIHNQAMGSWGILTLPSRYVTGVDHLAVVVGDNKWQEIPESNYVWHRAGWLQRRGWGYWNWFSDGYYYGNDQYYLPSWDSGMGAAGSGLATCTFWSGYTNAPEDVKEVVFEVAQSTMTMSSGNVKQMEVTGGYRIEFDQNFGMTLNCDQQNRLANYRIGMVA